MDNRIKPIAAIIAASLFLGRCTRLIVRSSDYDGYITETPVTASKTGSLPSLSSEAESRSTDSAEIVSDTASKKNESKTDSKTTSKTASKSASKTESKAASKPESKAESKAASKPESKAESKTAVSSASQTESKTPEEITPSVRITNKFSELTVGVTASLDIEFEPQDKRLAVFSSDPDIVTVNYDGTITAVSEGECTVTAHLTDDSASDEITITVVPWPEPGEFESVYIDGILIVNKKYSIPRSYDPEGLTEETQAAFNELVNAAAAEAGFSLYSLSDYRSYDEQQALYNDYVYTYGQAGADAICSIPGHSEHQTGMAIDVASYATGYFPGSAEAQWLQDNCARFGFIIRYPYGKESITGYSYEAWHIRYVGSAAQEIMDQGLCLEEYLGVD